MTSAVTAPLDGPVVETIVTLAGAVAEEVAEVGRLSADEQLTARLNNAVALLQWMQSQLTTDREQLAHAEARLREVLASDESPADAIRAVFEARGMSAAEQAGAAHSSRSPRSAPKPPTVDDVSTYLDARNPGDRAHEVRTLVGGFSKSTLLVRATLGGVDQDIVLRQIPTGRQAKSLVPEFDVVSFVHSHGLPAPRPLWIEPGDNALGGAFFATSRAAGSNIGDVWGQVGASRELCLEIADLYAALHSLPIDDVNAPVSPRSTPDELNAMITWQMDVLEKRGIEIEPVLAGLLAWLRSNIPAEPARKSLVHGDAAFSNLLVEDSHVSAILDWEAAHVGYAADELAYLRPSIEPVMPWQEFLDRYVESGGTAPSLEAMKFFEVWSHVWRHIGCLWLSQNFTQTARYPSAVAAFVHGPRFLDAAVKAAFL
ncbi:phosphotransferase family protein [Nocardia sp. NPDC059239]|uniref:phosphotransferase family protein n=1 Tax=unclassified Nocardia TaxID=2637762 RepID=UPI00368C5FDD